MGFQIDCPNCGRRSYHEFWFGGELRLHNPAMTLEEDYRNTWLRTNAAGPQVERWFHFAGCRRWVTLERDTCDNTITQGRIDIGSFSRPVRDAPEGTPTRP
jgi:heterotetrameric sarcosine oxidase delta subunit